MGKLVVTIGVGDQQGRQFEDLEVTVDTGSTFTAVPRALLAEAGSAGETLSPVPAGRRKLGPSGHRLDSGQAGGPDLRDTGDIRRRKSTQSAGSSHAGGRPAGSGPSGTTAGAGRSGAALSNGQQP